MRVAVKKCVTAWHDKRILLYSSPRSANGHLQNTIHHSAIGLCFSQNARRAVREANLELVRAGLVLLPLAKLQRAFPRIPSCY